LSIANFETLVATAARRALRLGEAAVVPRMSDVEALVASTAGRIELEALDDGRDARVLEGLVRAAAREVFSRRCPPAGLSLVVDAFDGTVVVDVGDDLGSGAYQAVLARVPALRGPVQALAGGDDPAMVASAVEFVLEGLHLSKRLNKRATRNRATYAGRR
ncbi:MAG: magnesium chelatase, partial [Acidimicrobiales bacterium]